MQHFLNILTILAFFMSSATWLYTLYTHSIKLSIEVKDHTKRFGSVQLYLYFQNNSAQYLAITGISILDKDRKLPCNALRSILRVQDGSALIETPTLPVNLSPCHGVCHAFSFSDCQDIELAEGKTLALEIYTNRCVLKRSVILPPQDHILHF